MSTDHDPTKMDRAIALALAAEAKGNLPIGAVIELGGEIIAEGQSAIVTPVYHPGRHAEMEALRGVPIELWAEAARMTCYTTLEPCMMCMGSLLLHGVGRVVFGAIDVLGGAGPAMQHLPEYYASGEGVPAWIGPVRPETCDPMYTRVHELFAELPCGH